MTSSRTQKTTCPGLLLRNVSLVLQDFTQWPTYPQLLVKGELLGGCDIIMEMQQDGSLKTAVQEALGTQTDSKKDVEKRLQQLLDSSPVMLFMKVRVPTFALTRILCFHSSVLCARWQIQSRSSQCTCTGGQSQLFLYGRVLCLGRQLQNPPSWFPVLF